MKILVVNSNTTQFVTDTVVTEAEKSASSGTEIKAVTGNFGARVISCRTEDAIGAYSTVELVAEHAHDCDAVLIAVSFDSGVRAARELLSIPVVGMTEAAILTACMVGGKVAVITFGSRAVPLYEEIINSYGLNDRLAYIYGMQVPPNFDVKNIRDMSEQLLKEINRLVKEKGAESVYLGGAVFAGMARDLRDHSPVPLIDGISCGIKHAETLAELNLKKPTTGSYLHPAKKVIVETTESLRKLYSELPE